MKPHPLPFCMTRRGNGRRSGGFTLIELMVAITLGMLIMAALLALYINITRTNNEMAKANRQIENGRFAIQLLQNDIVHAGFWGGYIPRYDDLFVSDGVLTTVELVALAGVDPCLDPAAWDDTFKTYLLAVPVRSFEDDATLSDCKVSGALAGSNILMVSHANTCVNGAVPCDGGTDTGPHIQVSGCTTPPPEASFVIDDTAFPLHQRDCLTPAERRKIVTNLYYIGESNGQPTLMRVSLDNGNYSTVPQPLIEGIEAFRVEFLVDRKSETNEDVVYTDAIKWQDATNKTTTRNRGDGAPDTTCYGSACTIDDLMNVVAVRLHVLARNLETTLGHKDTKTYQLGETDSLGPYNDGYKRHVFSTTVRLNNISGRRDTP